MDRFPLSDHNLAVPATPGSGPIHTDETLYDALSNPYALPDYGYDPGGEMGSAVCFLIRHRAVAARAHHQEAVPGRAERGHAASRPISVRG